MPHCVGVTCDLVPGDQGGGSDHLLPARLRVAVPEARLPFRVLRLVIGPRDLHYSLFWCGIIIAWMILPRRYIRSHAQTVVPLVVLRHPLRAVRYSGQSRARPRPPPSSPPLCLIASSAGSKTAFVVLLLLSTSHNPGFVN